MCIILVYTWIIESICKKLMLDYHSRKSSKMTLIQFSFFLFMKCNNDRMNHQIKNQIIIVFSVDLNEENQLKISCTVVVYDFTDRKVNYRFLIVLSEKIWRKMKNVHKQYRTMKIYEHYTSNSCLQFKIKMPLNIGLY